MTSGFLASATSFVWSAWGELGVPSVERRTTDLAIDLEPLIRLTNIVGSQDARLRSHAASWRAAFPELVSKARLKRLAGNNGSDSIGPVRARLLSGDQALDVSSASAVQLRIRSALGVSTRAEIIRQLVLDPPETRRSSSDLAQLGFYSKRNTEKALDALERGGWVSRIEGGASLRWSLADHGAIADLFSPLPANNASFLALAEILEALLSLDGVASAEQQVRSAVARESLVGLRNTAGWGSIRLPAPLRDVDAWRETLDWVSGLPASALETGSRSS